MDISDSKYTNGSCTNCLFAHFIDDEIGYCEYARFGKLPDWIKTLTLGRNFMIDRKKPVEGCKAWCAIQPIVSLEVD